ncbi:MAG: hypothetical protein H7338_16020 [Candidatus Sericytochromatia bacterium]|nr:hypothetical protein [Candidatus Sericytochromatia bacterium]
MPTETATIQSLKAVDAWIDVINANINGGVRTAYKASRLKFGGSDATVGQSGTLRTTPLQFPEPSLVAVDTVLDMSQGAIVGSTEDTHAAISGRGYFMVIDPQGKVLLTRDGEFHRDDLGHLVNSAGLVAVDRTVAINLDPTRYQANVPALTVADIGPPSPWYPGTGYGGQLFFPYVAGTPYDEAPLGYTNVGIQIRRTFFLNSADYATPGPVNLTWSSDDGAHLVVNGTYIGLATFAAQTVDIKPYLRPGANVVAFKAFEGPLFESVNVNCTIGSVVLSSAQPALWASRLTAGFPDSAVPTAAEIQQMIYTDPADLMVANGPSTGSDLQFTRYGSTVWQWNNQPTTPVPIDMPGRNGTGNLLTKSLESSNASMTQSVPELSLAQKLFSALTKVLQISQTNTDAVLNLVR